MKTIITTMSLNVEVSVESTVPDEWTQQDIEERLENLDVRITAHETKGGTPKGVRINNVKVSGVDLNGSYSEEQSN